EHPGGRALVDRLTRGVATPAVDDADRADRTVVVGSDGERVVREAGLVDRLAVVVAAPAVDGAGGGERAGVVLAGTHRGVADAGAEGAERLIGGLAVGVVGPALDATGGRDGAGVRPTDRDGLEGPRRGSLGQVPPALE